MEKIENTDLTSAIESHRKAVKDNKSQKVLKRGFLYQKQIEDFVFCSTEGLTDQLVQGSEFNNCVFKDCNLKNMILTETQIINTIFTGETALPNASDNEEHNVIWDIKSLVLVQTYKNAHN